MTQKKVMIWAYGSLREGMYNHKNMKLSKPITTSILGGFDLYSLGSYPACVKGKSKVVVELFEVDEQTFSRIDNMERGAGYYSELATDQMFNQGIIYLLPKTPRDCQLVKDGDWVAFVGADRKRYALQNEED
jgi:gamma-glutamylcyclotransferase (GGCT)/AIG2-like uncharacterized protein YtfP